MHHSCQGMKHSEYLPYLPLTRSENIKPTQKISIDSKELQTALEVQRHKMVAQ